MEILYVRQKYLSIHETRQQQFYNPKYVSCKHCKQIGHFNHTSTSFEFSYLWRHKAQAKLISANVWYSTSTHPQLSNDEYVWTWNDFVSIDNLKNLRVVYKSSFCFLFNIVYAQGIWDCKWLFDIIWLFLDVIFRLT